ncbi:MAG: hypothetical protein ACJ74O_11250 [Frankiaceae bacterium]
MTDRATGRDRLGVVAAAARRLATAGPAAALPAVVQALRDALAVEASVVVRAAGDAGSGSGAVLAAAHPSVVPLPRAAGSPAVLSVSVQVDGEPVCLMSVIAHEELGEPDRVLIEAHADLVGLALAAARPRAELAALVLDEEADRAQIAADLHEGAVGSLIAARHALATGHDGGAVGAVVQRAMRELRRVVTAQRARGIDGDLIRALRGLVDELRGSGRRATLSVTGLPRAGVSPACAVVAHRVAAAAVDGSTGRPVIAVTGCGEEAFTVSVTGAADPHDAGALDRWSRRARALGGDLERHPDGVVLRLPVRLPWEQPAQDRPPRPLAGPAARALAHPASRPSARPSIRPSARPFARPSRLPSRPSVARSSGAVS